jgi:hypothetical protein
MTTDPTLEALIAGGHYAIAADRYEEQTGDAELAALMRIDGLEWELVGGIPALRATAEPHETARSPWWIIWCGKHSLGTVYFGPEPEPLWQTRLRFILAEYCYGQQLADRFYELFCAAVPKECEL